MNSAVQTTAVLAVAAIHFLFLYLQMIVWQTPEGLTSLNVEAAVAKPFKTLALQQGLYNGFLGLGLVLSVLFLPPSLSHYGISFFLGCAMVAGIVGGVTADQKILYMQAVPAATALLVNWL